MKSFFKKIALVLALAMVVTMLPAKVVSAADAEGPQLSKQVKLYIGGDKSGSYSDSAYAKVWNKDGYKVQFSSSDETVATVGKNKGLVTAVGVGTAEITAVFTNEDGETVTKTCPVVVKKNAVAVGISANSAKTLAEGITAGETFQPKVFRTSADDETTWKGKDVITDGARFTSSDEKVFTVAKTTGKITAVAAGEATLTVWTVQGEKPEKDENGKVVEYLATTEKVEYPVKVVAGEAVITDVTLKAVDTLVLSVANATADNVKTLKVYNEVGGDITSLFKDPVLSDDKATVTLEKYLEFANGEKLSLVFGEGQAYEYTVKVGEAAALIIDGPTAAVFSKETSISYRVVDEFGTDLKKSGVSFEVADPTYAFVDSSNAKITMYQLGATVVLKGTYNTGKVDANWNPVLLTSEIAVTCVEESAVNVSGTKFGFALDKLTNDDLVMYVKDAGLRLYAEVTLSNDAKVNSDSVGTFTFEALTPSVLLVDAGTGILAPVSNGIARILVKCNYEGITSTAVAVINVRPNPEEATISVEYNGSTAISNSANVGESVTATIKAKDQYGNDYTPTINADGIDCLLAPTGVDKAVAKGYFAKDGASLTFEGADKVKGTYTYRVTTAEKHSVIISVTVNEPSTKDIDKAVSYKVQITSGTTKEIDPAKVEDVTCGDVTFRIIGLDNKGVAIDVVPASMVKDIEIPDSGKGYVATGSNEYVVHFAEKADEATGSAIIVNLTDGYNVKTGTFTIKANVKVSDTVTRVAVPANITVSVKASAPSYTIKSAAVKAASAAKADYEKAIMEQFVIGNDDSKYQVIAPYLGDVVTSIQSTGTSYVLVKNIKVYEKVGDSNNYVLHTINVNRYFSVTVGE